MRSATSTPHLAADAAKTVRDESRSGQRSLRQHMRAWLHRAVASRPTGPLIALTIMLVPIAAVLAAVTFTYARIDANGPAKVWGKGVGDVNGDTLTDLVVGSYLGGLYWYQNPDWTRRIISTGARVEEDLEVVDLDQDGRTDVVAITYGGITWFHNTTSGWRQEAIATGVNAHDVEVKDLDGDGLLDVAWRDQAPRGGSILLLRQSPPTVWTRSTIALPETGTGLLAVDLNRDGKPDLAIGKYWFLNNSSSGALSFLGPYAYSLGAPADAYVAAGTVNGDDDLVDLVVTPAHPQSGTQKVAWYQAPQSPTGGWTQRVLEDNAQSVVHFAGVADFDRDGNDDIATAMTHLGTNPKIKIYYNTGGTGTAMVETVIANASSHSMKVIDLNNDGNKSLVGADYNDAGRTPVELWRAASTAAQPAYLGCFRDQGAVGSLIGRDLDGFRVDDRASMTVARCASTCAAEFDFFGVQNGYACFCGSNYDSSETARNCNVPCPGDNSKICGGSYANSVYRLP